MANSPDAEPHSPEDQPSSPQPTAAPRVVSRTGRLAAGLALVLAIIALLVSGYLWYALTHKRGLADAKGRLVQVEKETAQLHAQSEQTGQELSSLRETQSTLRESLATLHDEIGKGRRTWLLAETENLLVIAQHRLDYARDAHLALEALRAADGQLTQLGDPQYQPVRKLLDSEMKSLEAFERLDVSGIAQRLGQLATDIGELPLAPEKRPAPPATGVEHGFLDEVWRDLHDLVRIRRTTDIQRPLLLPDQKYFLRQNLRLVLYGAQVALLHGDGATFEQNVKAARQWLNDYYDVGAQAVQNAILALDTMLKSQPAALPDISGSLKALRAIRAEQEGA
jgi:uroporphyrin-3 C-methyltransferase